MDDDFIIQYLPIYLGDSARAWLEYLLADKIKSWSDLRDTFIGNFQGTYQQPGNSWDLKICQQKKGETLREYIRRFSKRCNELPEVVDADVIGAFLSGTTCAELIHKLGCSRPKTTRELLDIATNHASGEEALIAMTRPKATRDQGSTKVEKKKAKQMAKKRERARGDEGIHDDEWLIAAIDPSGRKRQDGPGKFEKLMDGPCPHHDGPVNHKLKDCRTLKRLLLGSSSGPSGQKKEQKPPKEDGGGGATNSPTSTPAS